MSDVKVNIDHDGFWLKPKDIIAILVIVSYVILKILGLDGTVNAAFFLVLGYYFTKRVEGKDGGR